MNHRLLLLIIPCIVQGAAHSDPILSPDAVTSFLAYQDASLSQLFSQVYNPEAMPPVVWNHICVEGRIRASSTKASHVIQFQTALARQELYLRSEVFGVYHAQLRQTVLTYGGYERHPQELDLDTKKVLCTHLATLAYALHSCQNEHPDIFAYLYTSPTTTTPALSIPTKKKASCCLLQ